MLPIVFIRVSVSGGGGFYFSGFILHWIHTLWWDDGMMGCVGVQQGIWVFMEIGDKEDGSASSNMGSHGLFF